MSREPAPTDFVAPVEGVGVFVFAKRTMREEMRCVVELRRLTEGEPLDADTLVFYRAYADLAVLTVEAPPKWDLAELDAWDDADYAKLLKVWGALRDKEETFRAARKAMQAAG